MKKRLLLALLTFAMLLLCTGCNNKSQSKLLESLDLGEGYFQNTDYDAALLAFQDALDIDEKNVYANAMVATISYRQGDTETAATYQAQALTYFTEQITITETVQADQDTFFSTIETMHDYETGVINCEIAIQEAEDKEVTDDYTQERKDADIEVLETKLEEKETEQQAYLDENEAEITLYNTLLDDAIAFWGVDNGYTLEEYCNAVYTQEELDEMTEGEQLTQYCNNMIYYATQEDLEAQALYQVTISTYEGETQEASDARVAQYLAALESTQQKSVQTTSRQLVYAYCYVASYFDTFTASEQLAILSRTAITGYEGVLYYDTNYLDTAPLVNDNYDFVGIQEEELDALITEVFANASTTEYTYFVYDKDMRAVLSLAYPVFVAESNSGVYNSLLYSNLLYREVFIDGATLIYNYTIDGIAQTFADAVAAGSLGDAWPENNHVQEAVYVPLQYFEDDMIEMATNSMSSQYLTSGQLELLDYMGSFLYYQHTTYTSLLNLNEKLELLYATYIAQNSYNLWVDYIVGSYEYYTYYQGLVEQTEALERYVLPS